MTAPDQRPSPTTDPLADIDIARAFMDNLVVLGDTVVVHAKGLQGDLAERGHLDPSDFVRVNLETILERAQAALRQNASELTGLTDDSAA